MQHYDRSKITEEPVPRPNTSAIDALLEQGKRYQETGNIGEFQHTRISLRREK